MSYVIYNPHPNTPRLSRVNMVRLTSPMHISVEGATQFMREGYPGEHMYEVLPDEVDTDYAEERLRFWRAMEA